MFDRPPGGLRAVDREAVPRHQRGLRRHGRHYRARRRFGFGGQRGRLGRQPLRAAKHDVPRVSPYYYCLCILRAVVSEWLRCCGVATPPA